MEEKEIFFDVRTQEEFDLGHIPGAIHKDIFQEDSFESFLETLDREKTYHVYCRTENRSALAVGMMENKGFSRVHILSGGWAEWEKIH